MNMGDTSILGPIKPHKNDLDVENFKQKLLLNEDIYPKIIKPNVVDNEPADFLQTKSVNEISEREEFSHSESRLENYSEVEYIEVKSIGSSKRESKSEKDEDKLSVMEFEEKSDYDNF